MGSTLDQVKSTMLVTACVFIGVEGANVFSARAADRADVGRATVLGFVLTLLLLIAVSLLSLGILRQPELAALKNPSMAGVLEAVAGPWGAVLISIGLIVSVGGALLAWTLLAAESVFTPAREKVMPRALASVLPMSMYMAVPVGGGFNCPDAMAAFRSAAWALASLPLARSFVSKLRCARSAAP